MSIIAVADAIEAFSAQGKLLWRVTADGIVTGMLGLPDGGVVAHTRSGQAFTLRNGRYAALWQVTGPDAPIVALGDQTLVFVTEGGGLAAYHAAGRSALVAPRR